MHEDAQGNEVDMIGEPGQADFDSLPENMLGLLQRGMAQYRTDPVGAELLFAIARSQAPACLPLYRVLFKIYNRQRQFDLAYDTAARGLAEAIRRANLPPDWREWTSHVLSGSDASRSFSSHALLMLKAMAFLELRRGNESSATSMLERLEHLDPDDGMGSSVVAALAAGIHTESAA
jgi:hypothetical protein